MLICVTNLYQSKHGGVVQPLHPLTRRPKPAPPPSATLARSTTPSRRTGPPSASAGRALAQLVDLTFSPRISNLPSPSTATSLPPRLRPAPWHHRGPPVAAPPYPGPPIAPAAALRPTPPLPPSGHFYLRLSLLPLPPLQSPERRFTTTSTTIAAPPYLLSLPVVLRQRHRQQSAVGTPISGRPVLRAQRHGSESSV
jgi:hypothetical protein